MLVLALPSHAGQARGGATSRGTSRTAAPGTVALPVARHADPTPEEQAVAERARAFDLTVLQRSEAEREMNALRQLSMEQIKRDDELLKKWIALI
jgi:hypothetical protein